MEEMHNLRCFIWSAFECLSSMFSRDEWNCVSLFRFQCQKRSMKKHDTVLIAKQKQTEWTFTQKQSPCCRAAFVTLHAQLLCQSTVINRFKWILLNSLNFWLAVVCQCYELWVNLTLNSVIPHYYHYMILADNSFLKQ